MKNTFSDTRSLDPQVIYGQFKKGEAPLLEVLFKQARLMAPQFFGQEIKVTVNGEVKVPTSFRLDNREYVISDIIEAWPDYGFGQSPLRRKRWWQRRHRNYYRVKTTQGEAFEIYYDRGTKLSHPERKKWFLHRQL